MSQSPAKSPGFLEALARDVAMVLKSLGGSAHQNVVIDCVAALKRQRGEPVTQDLRLAVVEAFDSAFDSLLRIKRHFDGDEVFAALPAAAH